MTKVEKKNRFWLSRLIKGAFSIWLFDQETYEQQTKDFRGERGKNPCPPCQRAGPNKKI